MAGRVIKKYGAYRIVKLKTKVNWEARAFGAWKAIDSALLSDKADVSRLIKKWNRWAGKPHKLIKRI